MKFRVALLASAAVLFFGCATNRVDWQSRVGNYTFDQAVLEMGPPDKVADLKDGTKVAEWLTSRGRSLGGSFIVTRGGYVHHIPDPEGPDYFIRLAFDPEGRLTDFKRVVK
jgi:hypothetical protein